MVKAAHVNEPKDTYGKNITAKPVRSSKQLFGKRDTKKHKNTNVMCKAKLILMMLKYHLDSIYKCQS
jgi:hypothetical protein